MHPSKEAILTETRRQFFARGGQWLGALALASLVAEEAKGSPKGAEAYGGLPNLPHFAPKAKRVIYLHTMGAPPQMDLFDYKPKLKDWYGKELPDSIRQGQRLTTMTSGQARFPIAPPVWEFRQHGQSGAWISDLLPNIAKMADDMAIVRSMHTEAINHEPAITFIQTGRMIAGLPCIGSWLSYGLGSMNRDLPTFVVMNAKHSHPRANVQAISTRLWSAGFLSAEYAGVALRAGADPVLYVKNPDGVPQQIRRRMLDGLSALNQIQHQKIGDPETLARIEQFEMAFRMQTSVPEMSDLASEPESTYKRYGEDARETGTVAYSLLMARRLIERGVRFVQIYHRGWERPRCCRASAGPSTSPAGRWCRTSKNVACLMTRWWCGAASSAARSTPRVSSHPPTTAATIIRAASASGWPAPASRVGSFTVKRTISPTTSSGTRSTFATSRRRSCTCSALTTNGSPTGTRGWRRS